MMFRKEINKSTLFYGLTIPGTFFIFISLFGLFGELSILLYVGILSFFLYFISHYYEQHVDDHLVVHNEMQIIRCYPGDEGELQITIAQNGLLPILRGSLVLTFDDVIDLKTSVYSNHDHTASVEIPITLLSFEKKKITIPFKATERGVAHIRSLKLNFPNILGLGKVFLTYNPYYKTEIIVYPKLKKVEQLDIMEPKRNGDHQSKHSIFEQPILPVGTRDYVSGDPFNRIHWKASARKDVLQTKVVEKVNQLSWLILINVTPKGKSFDEIEDYLKQVAYICKYATERHIPIEIYMNIPARTMVPFYHLPLGQGKNHYAHALETLARVNRNGLTMSYSAMLKYIDRTVKPPYIIQVGNKHNKDLFMLNKWHRQGHLLYTLDEGQLQPLSLKERGDSYGTGS